MKQFLDLTKHILEKGKDKTDRTGTGTRAIFGYQMRFDMADGFPLVTTKKTHTKSIIYELLWFLQGNTNIQYLVKNGVNIWNDWPYKAYCEAQTDAGMTPLTQDAFVEAIKTDDEFAKLFGDCGPIYGKQWVAWDTVKLSPTEDPSQYYPEVGHINQIQNAIDALKKTPDGRRIIVTAWRPDQIKDMSLPPCHAFFQFGTEPLSLEERVNLYGVDKIQTNSSGYFEHSLAEQILEDEGVPKFRLNVQLYQRSCDTMLGVPFNIASYSLLLHMVAQVVNMVPGDFIWTGGDVHIYSNHLNAANELLTREPHKLPTLKLNPLIDDIFAFKYEDFTIEDYQSHPAIKLPVAV